MAEAKGGGRLGHNASHVCTRRARITRVLAENVEHVAKVKADGAHVKQHLGVPERRECRLRLEKKVAYRAS
jgi:hypothetical protein